MKALAKITVLLAVVLWQTQVFAQAIIEFEKLVHDFGEIFEDPEGATYSFKFTNKGKEPLIISSARPSCGCTVPTWTQEPVLPGGTGVITAKYNSMGRPGSFNKTITVESNSADQPVIYLTIKGEVKAKPATSESDSPAPNSPLPELTLLKTEYNFGKIQVGEKITHSFPFKNTGRSPLNIKSINSSCNCTTFAVNKQGVAPGEEGVLTITYAPTKESATGEALTVIINAPTKESNKVFFKGQVVSKLVKGSPVQKTSGLPFK